MAIGDEEGQRPSGDECVLAGLAHVAMFGGMWIVGPLVIYLWKREQSRFVAFHSLQAIFLSLVAMVAGTLGVIAFFAATLGGAFLSAAKHSEPIGAGGLIVGLLLGGIITLSPLVLAVVAAYRAFKGQTWSIPLVGRIATRILAR